MVTPESSGSRAEFERWHPDKPVDTTWVLGEDHRSTSPLVHELAAAAVEMATAAALYAQQALSQPRVLIETKSSATDMVSEVDKGAEQLIVSVIDRLRPDDGILGEEGASRPSKSGIEWVVDPVDGTTNYLFGIDSWSVSVAARGDGQTLVGIVAAPSRGELFGAGRGQGAWLNGRRVACNPERHDVADALLATGFGYDPEQRAEQGAAVGRLIAQIRDIRRFGSAALDLCSVAMGRVDAYYEWGMNPWDIAAGQLIAQEAGATVEVLPGGVTLASPPKLFQPLLHLLESVGGPGFD